MTGHAMDNAPKRILLIDPDPTLCQTLAEQLAQQEGLRPVPAASGEAALAILADSGADAALLDGALAGDGLIPALRAGGLTGPLILLLPAGMGLPAGADDHLDKPIRLGTLLARLKALLRQADAVQATSAISVRIGPYRFLPAVKRLEMPDGAAIRLTEKETQILDHLCRRGGMAARQDLLDAVWGYGAGIDTHTLETHIYRLRRKIGAGPGRDPLLLRVEGGYRLTLEPVPA